MLKFYKRRITQSEAELVIKQIKLTPNIMGYSLREWMAAENIMVAENEDGNIAGVCLSYDFHQNWNKIAALFVFEDFRRRGIGKSLFHEAVKDAMERKKNIYTISSNPIVIKLMSELNFVMFNNLFRFPKNNNQYYLTFYIHTIKWLLNFYRIQEIVRKKIVYESKVPFVYGIKLFTD